MLKSSVLGSLALVPFIPLLVVVGCSSDGSTDDASAGKGGAHSGGTNAGGSSGAHAGSAGTAGASLGSAGDDSAAGEAGAGSEEMAGAGGEAAGSGGGHAGTAGSSAGRGGTGGSAGSSGGSGGASAGNAGTGGSSGSGGTSGNGGASGGNAGAGGGTPCTNTTQCAGTHVCLANLCQACEGVTYASGNTVYYVDPVSGTDSNGTGSARSGGQAANACAFKTITRALQVIGSPTQASGAIIKVKSNAGAASGETFPISVPQYVVIQGATAPVTVTVPAGKVGFAFSGTGSVLKDLVIDGGGTSDIGVRLSTADASATLDAVIVQNTGATGVDVNTGTLNLLAGTSVQRSGTAQSRQSGITVEGTGRLVAKLTSGRVSVFNNTARGIRVLERGSVDLEGIVTSNTSATPTSYNGTIVVSQNNEANLELNQTGTPRPLNTIKGVLATGSVTSDGLLVFGGSAVSVRKSVFVGNGLSGIHLSHTGNRTTGVGDLSAVDLGKANDPGLNVVQGANDQLNNKSAGICINVDPARAQAINAQGNLFAAVDCSTTAATLTKNLGACAPVTTKPDDIGWEWVTAQNTSSVTVDAAKCN